MLFTSAKKLLELANLIKRINTDLLLAMPIVSVKIGDHCYHGLCDIGASVSAIPYSSYQEIMNDIAPAEIEDIDVTIKLANGDTITHLGLLEMLKSYVGK